MLVDTLKKCKLQKYFIFRFCRISLSALMLPLWSCSCFASSVTTSKSDKTVSSGDSFDKTSKTKRIRWLYFLSHLIEAINHQKRKKKANNLWKISQSSLTSGFMRSKLRSRKKQIPSKHYQLETKVFGLFIKQALLMTIKLKHEAYCSEAQANKSKEGRMK